MAPEALAALQSGLPLLDARGDLYALGVILYELLTGHHPFPLRQGGVDEVLPLMIEDRLGPLPSLRQWNPAVSPATEEIILRGLEPNPARRYQGAGQLADDLHRQLDDCPLRYAPDRSPRERTRKWARRHPRLSLGMGLVTVSALLMAGLVAVYNQRQRRFGPVEAALAFRRLVDEHETARILLLDPAEDRFRRHEGMVACRRALERYGVLETPSWPQSPLVANLSANEQTELRTHVGELLMLWARALARQSAGHDTARRTELVRDALRRNTLAQSCYQSGEVPRVLWSQRSDLARLAGDEAEAARSRVRADNSPVRSLREYSLLFVDDPDHAISPRVLPALAEASRRNPRDFALWMNLGQCHALQGRLSEAEDCFTVAIELRPQSPWAYFHRGRVELDRQAYDQASLDFDQALRLHPQLLPAYVDRALARMGKRNNAGAIEDLTQALDGGALETRIYFIRAEARARSGDRAGAERDRAEGLGRRPIDDASWAVRGLARMHSDPTGALADFEEALKLDPHMRSALQNKAALLSDHLGRWEEAIPVLDRLVSLYPDYVPARVGRGVLLARLGRRRDAIRDAEESRNRDVSGDTTYRVACIYALTSKAEPADRPRALRMLAAALNQGSRWLEIARTDRDLDALRDWRQFRDLIKTFADQGRPGA